MSLMNRTTKWVPALAFAAVLMAAAGVLGHEAPPPPPPESEPPPPAQTPPAGEAPQKPATMTDAGEWWLEGHYDKALAAYDHLAQSAADDAGKLAAGLGAARCRISVGEYDEALKRLESMPPARERSSEWHTLMAELGRMLGDYDAALSHAEAAFKIDKNAAAARWIHASTLEYLGRRDQAVEAYAWFDRQLVARDELPHDAGWLTATAQGFYRYSVLTRTDVARRTKHVLGAMLQAAYEKVDRSYWPARIAAAELLRANYNNDTGDGSVADYAAALEINENLPAAHVGLGEVALESWAFEQVEQHAEKALKINPRCAPAVHLLAKCRVLERRYSEAAAETEKALQINPRDLVALSIRAAAAACVYDAAAVQRDIERIQAVNPKCATLYRLLGDAMSAIRQYQASERYYQQAIEFDPTDPNPRTELGLMYMQWGLEDRARAALDGAWALDPFNVRTFNTLELLDSLQAYAIHETEHFIVRYDDKLDPGLGPYVAAYLEEIHPQICGDFETKLADKTIIEFFPTHHAFAVRITGKPWIHTVGACTGRVIALDSPRSDPALQGPYNVASVLRHEFTHTVTLAATENRIPHWFTEGLAVWQEEKPRSFEWAQSLAEAVRKNELFTLESINWGFMRPRRPNDRQNAYAQSEWMCEYIVERFGYAMINKMLAAFRDRRPQDEVFRTLLGMETEAFDQDFRVWARAQAKGWGFDLTSPEDAEALRREYDAQRDDLALMARLARAELDAGNGEQALGLARKVVEADEENVGALAVLAEVGYALRRQEGSPRERRHIDDELLPDLERLAELAPDHLIVHKFLGDIALDRERFDEAAAHYEQHRRVSPTDPAGPRGLAAIFLKRGDDAAALPLLIELARTEEHDPEIPGGIARILSQRGGHGEAVYWYQRALFINPFSIALHKELAEARNILGDSAGALREYLMLMRLEPQKAAHYTAAAFAAHKLGDANRARELARQALERDPQSAAKGLLEDGE